MNGKKSKSKKFYALQNSFADYNWNSGLWCETQYLHQMSHIDLSDMNGPPYGELNFLLLLFLLPVIDEIFRLPISFF